jgi:AAA ATPase domain
VPWLAPEAPPADRVPTGHLYWPGGGASDCRWPQAAAFLGCRGGWADPLGELALIGRAAETEIIDRLLDEAFSGRSGVLVLIGEAGVGKSALLAYARARADGMGVLQTVGVQSEAEIEFALLATLTADATLTDDGHPRSLYDWIDREIFSVHGHMSVEHEDQDGLHLLAQYRNDTWGEMSTFWRFQVAGGKISHIDTGQARA